VREPSSVALGDEHDRHKAATSRDAMAVLDLTTLVPL
jgi:hypothetical protein